MREVVSSNAVEVILPKQGDELWLYDMYVPMSKYERNGNDLMGGPSKSGGSGIVKYSECLP